VGRNFPTQFKLRYLQDIVCTAPHTVVGCNNQSVDAVWGNFRDLCKIDKYTVWAELRIFYVEPGGTCSKHWALSVVCKSNRTLCRKLHCCSSLENSGSLGIWRRVVLQACVNEFHRRSLSPVFRAPSCHQIAQRSHFCDW